MDIFGNISGYCVPITGYVYNYWPDCHLRNSVGTYSGVRNQMIKTRYETNIHHACHQVPVLI